MKHIIIVLVVCVMLLSVTSVHAQEFTPTPTPVEYTLAYPGLLPDNPLYKIKAFRDWLISILIADPVKKISFDVLQADKRLGAAQYLFAETPPKNDLAIETLSKGENYFFQALQQIPLARLQGERLYDSLQKLRLSNAKHLEVVLQLEQGKKGAVLQGLKVQEERIRDFGNTVKKEGLRQ